MSNYWEIISKAYSGYANYLWNSLTKPIFEGDVNYFYFLITISLLVWGLEIILPWRKEQKIIRKDFWLDAFYMFFNLFLVNLFFFIALSNITSTFLQDSLSFIGVENPVLINLSNLHWGWQLLIFFLLYDFIQWGVHNILHRVPWLWKFHKVHHSVKEMGFAAHLRFHFMESVFYKSALFIGISLIFSFELKHAFVVYSIAILIGHLNHANLGWDYGPFKYVLNNPKMHIWHHSKALPASHPKGMNFGISLSIWDYIFRTNYIPYEGAEIELGFECDEKYPEGFIKQTTDPFKVSK